jgi:predicted NAD/FAD-dependent oxidoreductase
MQCDVAVVGAGPGGSAAAYWLARSGADVLLVDKAHFPRSKPCGDGLTPRAVELLESMGLGDSILKRGWTFTGPLFSTCAQAMTDNHVGVWLSPVVTWMMLSANKPSPSEPVSCQVLPP